ncbi:MAG: TrbC/VirB2 family protein [Sphingomonadales bacterium]|nr:TrbC/VirB2 family protein [Sphingomonadales bacterium]MBK6492507.1 TrbC/VirB2 family protein [Sphingomonadales bacterium]MBK6720620.1 TrbC/VirB2 family protein [Sphingomonadales bacterium]MBK7285334.1 TrbC/VirB2 family protein [Sphingomonadales bacterium]MBK8273805.1 TrbC/VirB2 family protein [Sphingomonadales bacterium]
MSGMLLTILGAASLAEPPSPGVLRPAAMWIEGILTGTLASVLAIIAVAALGFALLSGRIDMRRGLTVLVGCFILFGAPAIAAGLCSIADASSTANGVLATAPMTQTPIPPAPQNPNYFDPYAGASVPVR